MFFVQCNNMYNCMPTLMLVHTHQISFFPKTPMKRFNLVYSPDEREISLFSNLDLTKLTEPLTIEREEPVQEDEAIFERKKSEVVEYEDEAYVSLKEKEQDPYIITDAESRTMCGKFQNVTEGTSMYFAFVNAGDCLKVVPVSKWYGFVQKTQFSEGDVDGIEKNFGYIEPEVEESESVHEIDYNDAFDDDDSEVRELRVYKEKELSTSGKEIQGLVECYEEKDPTVGKEPTEETAKSEERMKKVKTEEKRLTTEDIRKAFKGKKVSIKDLLLNLKADFKMDEAEKAQIIEFVKENCIGGTDPVTGESFFKLKK